MSRQNLFRLIFSSILILLIAACGQESQPTEAPPTPTPIPATSTSAPTATLLPSPTPRPTSTPPPTPSPTALPPLDVQIDYPEPMLPWNPVTLIFNQPMEPQAVADALSVRPAIEGTFEWNQDHTRLSLQPETDLQLGRSYQITLKAGLESAGGTSLNQPKTWRVQIAFAPRVTARKPSRVKGNERRPTFELTFSHDMEPDSVLEAFSVEPQVTHTLRYEKNTLYIQIEQAMDINTRYQFSLDSSASDVHGIPLRNAYSWSYSLADPVAGTAWPDQQRGRDAPLLIRFNYPMDQASVERALSIEPAIEGELSWDEAGSQATFTPAAPLPSQTEYTVQLGSGLRDADGFDLPSPEPFHFSTPLPILAVQPGPDRSARPNTLIKVTFDRPMDPEKTEAAFAISPTVAGEFTWQETSLIFRPEGGALAEQTDYVVTIDTTASGQDGELVLNQPYQWRFHTSELQDVGNFGWGPNAQVLDADGRRAVQFGLFQSEPAPLTFKLYRLNLTQFLDRYSSGFRGVAGREYKAISTEGTSLVKSWQIETPQGKNKHGNVHETLIPQDVPPGLYVLNLRAGHVNDQLILVLSRHTLAVKQAEGQIFAWVTDININGGSVPGVQVSVYARDGQLLSQGQADQNGVYRAQVSRDPQPLIVVARDGEDVTASGLSNEWRSHTADQWWWWWAPNPTAQDYAAYIYTDRPIYRPGQTVFYKGIIRQDDDAILSMFPEGSAVTARVRDARNNVVQTIELRANHFGTVHGEFQLAEGAMLGDYAVEMSIDGESHRQTFKVQDYRKPDYQVSVATDAQRYVAGQTIEVMVDTSYFFGQPVPDASLTVRQYELSPRDWWDQSSDEDYIWFEGSWRDVRGKTDENGRFSFTREAEVGYRSQTVHWGSDLRHSIQGIEVTVDDGSHQTVSGLAVVHVFDAAEKIRLDTHGYFKTPGQPFSVEASAYTVFDEPVDGRDLLLELRRYSRSSGDYDTVVQSAPMSTGPDGQARTRFTAQEAGYYQMRLSGTDRSGHQLSYTSWLWVFDDASRWTHHDSQVSIAAEHDSYAPGEVARLAIETPFSGPALLTFERGTTRREQLIELSAPLTLVDVPIQPDDAPNIFITVNVWQELDTSLTPDTHFNLPDSRLHTASVELQVPVTDKRLNVSITPDKERYAPREKARFTVRVTDERGEPVSAEVSLALVDEAIFGLSEELSGPMFDAFYYQREHIVRTYDSLALTRYIPDWGRGGGGGGGGGDPLANPRSDFPDTAAWRPVVHTDWKGEAVIELTLPDSLTSWRLTAKAVSPDTKVGEATANVLTQQPIVVRPILPRSLTAGDQVDLSAMVHNYSQDAQQVQVWIESDLLDLVQPLTQTIDLAPDEVRLVGWSAVAGVAGPAQVIVAADAGEGGADAVQLTIPVRPLAIPEVETLVGEFAGQFETILRLPQEALALSSVKIDLSRSIAGSLLTGLEYLTGFPYGCVEQTMSKALPNAAVGRAFHQLGIGNPSLEADLPPKINASLQRLYGYQHNDGGWGWWYDDDSDAYQTAWVVFGLAVTAEAGYEVDPQVIERGVEWLAQNLSGTDVRTRAYALYSLTTAGYTEIETDSDPIQFLEAAQSLAERVEELDPFSQAALALALHELGETAEARQILDYLAETATLKEGEVFWTTQVEDGHYYHKTMSSATRSTALALSAFVRIAPGHELEPGIVRWLMGKRQRYGWGSTNETSFAILGLTDHLLAVEAATADTAYSVELNGQVIASGGLNRGEPAVSLEIPADQMRRGDNSLRIQQSGGGRLYYVINHRVYLAQPEIEAAGQVKVSRVYLNPETNKAVESLKPGQLVKVQIRLNMPDDAYYVIVEDQLPGGLEALNEGLNTSSHQGSAYEYQEPHRYWQSYGYNHKAVHGDRVSFFITELSDGPHTYTYYARATHAGQFVAMPTEVSAMYDATVWGRSASDRLTIVGRLGPLAN